MCRISDIALIVCLSVVFVGVESASDYVPPPKNVNYIWVSPFTLNVTWEKPDGLDPTCRVNYTVEVHDEQLCQSKNPQKKRTQNLNCTFYLSNEKGLCITVTTNSENCGNRPHSLPRKMIIPSPPVTLVRNLSCHYHSQNNMKCTWKTADDVQNLHFYYWLTKTESKIRKCSLYTNEQMLNGCEIYSEIFKDSADELFIMFDGTHKGISVKNTFQENIPSDNVKLRKPELKITRHGQILLLQTIRSDFKNFSENCFKYNYTYTKCNTKFRIEENINHTITYDPDCKYTASVQIILHNRCGKGKSEPSDEVEYGENTNPNVPVLLAVMIVPLIVSCCLIGCLVFIHRHKNIILPKVPDPSHLFKDMFYNNIRTTDDLKSNPVTSLYVPIEETVSSISLEPENTPLSNGL